MNSTHFKAFTKQDIAPLIRNRRFETKLGERIQVLPPAQTISEALQKTTAKYIIIGVPEDIGVQANLGKPGTSTAWLSFVQSFLNIQSNDFLSGDTIAVIGYFDFSDLQLVIDKNAHDSEEKIAAYRHAVNTIDEEVESLTKAIVAAGKFPVVIGGGQNNAYPLIKGAAKGLHQLQAIAIPQINCINLDAFADYQPAEGRHNGNAFRYADEDGFLQRYCVLGVHENYLQQNVWSDMVNNPFIDYITFEDIFIHEKRSFYQAVLDAVSFTGDNFCGIELDLRCIENGHCSSITPAGLSTVQARQYISICSANTKACYLHISEGAAHSSGNSTDNETGKLISYLVTDFIKMQGE